MSLHIYMHDLNANWIKRLTLGLAESLSTWRVLQLTSDVSRASIYVTRPNFIMFIFISLQNRGWLACFNRITLRSSSQQLNLVIMIKLGIGFNFHICRLRFAIILRRQISKYLANRLLKSNVVGCARYWQPIVKLV